MNSKVTPIRPAPAVGAQTPTGRDNLNLLSGWRFTQLHPNGRYDNLAAALRALNFNLNTSYTLSRFGEWENGKRPVPQLVQKLMRLQVLQYHRRQDLLAWLEPPDLDVATPKLKEPR